MKEKEKKSAIEECRVQRKDSTIFNKRAATIEATISKRFKVSSLDCLMKD